MSYSNDDYRNPKDMSLDEIAQRMTTVIKELRDSNNNFKDRKGCYGRWAEWCNEEGKDPDSNGQRAKCTQNVQVSEMLLIGELVELVNTALTGE